MYKVSSLQHVRYQQHIKSPLSLATSICSNITSVSLLRLSSAISVSCTGLVDVIYFHSRNWKHLCQVRIKWPNTCLTFLMSNCQVIVQLIANFNYN